MTEQTNDDRTEYQSRLDMRFAARYHELAERGFLRFNQLTTFLSLLLASSALAVPEWMTVFAVIIAVLQAAALAGETVQRAVQHRDLRRQYIDLDARVADGTVDWRTADATMLRIEATEPPSSYVLRVIAQRDNLRAAGHDEMPDALPLTWWARCVRLAVR